MGTEKRTGNPCPALFELRERLVASGVNADPMRVASALLDMVQSKQENDQSIIEWVEQLAIDVTRVTGACTPDPLPPLHPFPTTAVNSTL
jgi:hypothetical protein